MADVVIQAQSTLFDRQGETLQIKGYALPPLLAAYIAAAYEFSAPALSLTNEEQVALYGLLTQDSQIIPGGQTLYDIQSVDPTLFPGAGELQNIYEKDPFSGEYETQTTALFLRSYSVAYAQARSGPANVRGGTVRQAFELAELDNLYSINRFREIWQNQVTVAGLVIQATQVANAVEAERRNSQLRAQQQQAATEQGRVMQTLSAAEQLARDRDSHVKTLAAASEFLGQPRMMTTEDMQGEGFQGGVTNSFGSSYWR